MACWGGKTSRWTNLQCPGSQDQSFLVTLISRKSGCQTTMALIRQFWDNFNRNPKRKFNWFGDQFSELFNILVALVKPAPTSPPMTAVILIPILIDQPITILAIGDARFPMVARKAIWVELLARKGSCWRSARSHSARRNRPPLNVKEEKHMVLGQIYGVWQCYHWHFYWVNAGKLSTNACGRYCSRRNRWQVVSLASCTQCSILHCFVFCPNKDWQPQLEIFSLKWATMVEVSDIVVSHHYTSQHGMVGKLHSRGCWQSGPMQEGRPPPTQFPKTMPACSVKKKLWSSSAETLPDAK